MLPFAHSNRSNDRYNPVSSIIRRTNRSNSNAPQRELSYNSSSQNYRYPEERPSFRQQFRPLHEQVMEFDLKNIIVPLTTPLQENIHPMSDGGFYYRNQMPHAPPPSPLLDQVLTETRLGSDDWDNNRKKSSSKLLSIRKYALLVMGLMAVGVFLYQASIIFKRGGQGSIKLRMSREDTLDSISRAPVEPSVPEAMPIDVLLPIERASMNRTERPHERILSMESVHEKIIDHPPSFVEETVSEILSEKVLEKLVILSINEDYETTVEVIRD